MPYKALLQKIEFKPKDGASGIFYKKYDSCEGYCLEVDFDNSKFNYGALILSDSKTTLNFSQAENWVVLECVDRLLEKGYKPQNIKLEKVYPAGHGHSGRLDICVTRDDGSAYLLIECKTYGKEFDNAVKKLQKDGGQLFTYFKFSNKADVLMLYASGFKGDKIHYKNEIVKIEEDYRAGDVRDFYEKWSKLTKDNGVFENWVSPYNFESKTLTINDLEEIRQEDSSFIFNRFLEILRHNVVSDKGNAFNRIFTLFLCKIYDEKIREGTSDELDFQWREGTDNHRNFQIRLTDLYKNGMHEFLEKVVTDFSETEFNNKFKHLDDELRNSILGEFQKLRLEKNNEFAIKDVYDEQSFNENAVVVKEIVQLLEKFKLRYTKKQQYLSDFFELLLTTGLKQESGQFFTPVPVAQFVIKSLPVDTILENKLSAAKMDNDTLLPYVMDYAAGSGHFLTETMHEMQRLIKQKDDKKYHPSVAKKIRNWQDDHFAWAIQYIYGIEKDYRLVKVGKVGCYLHGDGLANVIHSDGLARFNHPDYKGKLLLTDKDFKQDNKQFDILVSNPPYSVSAFKNAARTFYKEEDFELYDRLTDSSSEIECLFIERAKQLLKDGAVTGIILPSSILSNGGIYAKSRELILQFFEVIAIAELGSNTFMATGANTVTLFLRRRSNYDSINVKKAVEKFFTTALDLTINGIEKPVAKYVSYVWEGISYDDYVSLVQKAPSQKILDHEIYRDYKNKIKAKGVEAFWNQVLEKEADKLFYYILVYNQKVVLVKSGEKDAEKRFLGYEFSNRRGSEGIHPVQRGKSIEECTQLFDPEIFDNPKKASTYIYKAFQGDFDFPIDAAMQNNVTRHSLLDMLTFDRLDFEKNISLSIKKKVKIDSKWEIVALSSVVEIIGGGTPDTNNPEYWDGDIPWLSVVDFNNVVRFVEKTEKRITEKGLQNSSTKYLNAGDVIISARGTVGALAQLKLPMTFNQSCYGLRGMEKLDNGFLYYILKSEMDQLKNGSYGAIFKAITTKTFDQIRIPLPPKDIQEIIVNEIEQLEEHEKGISENIECLQEDKRLIVSNVFSQEIFCEISKIGKVMGGKRIPKGMSFHPHITDHPYIRVSDFSNGSIDTSNLKYIDDDVFSLINRYTISKDDVYISIAGTIGLVGLVPTHLDQKSLTENAAKIVISNQKAITKEFLYYCLNSDYVQEQIKVNTMAVGVPKLALKRIETLRIPLPSLAEQQRLVDKIEVIEKEIAKLESEIALIPQQREAILKKYL